MIKILKGRKLMRAESFNYLIDYLFMYFIIILYFCYIILTINYTFWFKNELRNFGCGCRLCLEKGERLSGALGSRPPWRRSTLAHLKNAATSLWTFGPIRSFWDFFQKLLRPSENPKKSQNDRLDVFCKNI